MEGHGPGTWQKQTDYFEWKFGPAFDAFRAQRAELLENLEPLPVDPSRRAATVGAPPGVVYEYDVLYYGDWMARHERGHLKHIARILKELG